MRSIYNVNISYNLKINAFMKALHSFRRICNIQHLCQLQGQPIYIHSVEYDEKRVCKAECEGDFIRIEYINYVVQRSFLR